MKLFMIPSCPFVQRVLIACRVRKILDSQIEPVLIELSEPPAELLQVNPTGSVPTLIDDSGAGFHESHVVMQYLDSLDAPGPKLFGDSSFEVAQTQAHLELNSSTILAPIQQALYSRGNLNTLHSAASKLETCWAALEKALKQTDGFFIGGSSLNALDISLAPFIVRLPYLFELHPFIKQPATSGAVARYVEALRSLDEVRQSMPDESLLRKSVEDFASPSALLTECIKAPRTLLENQKSVVNENKDSLSQWRVEHDGQGFCLKATFRFKTHAEAVAQLNWLHDAQETTDHHTSITMHDFQRAEITMVTHEPRWGITEKDLALAKAIQQQFSGNNKK